ncbi:WASH complex subunit 2 [Anopheles nili]|uniref:WASH complex subunit 2 n=1 Tax=Anopheles nili TaxID=185578 RepID=UPI00237A67F3|nr:WASH complex subunit 2 [Anopheles nili]
MELKPDELRQRIPSWSLESDGQLLQYMISIGKNIEDKCSKTRNNLNSLMLQVKQTEVKLANAANQFSAVEQVKFVENRVEEDDESFYGLRRRRQQVDEQQKDTGLEDGSERSLDDLVQLAVERSIEGMYQSYEKVTLDLTDSDSSDEDTAPSATRLMDQTGVTASKATVMRAVPRFAFIDRPLPHVIGSKEWQNKWHVGLIDSDDESNSDRKEEYSDSPSETDDGGMFPSQPNSKNHTPSESESSIWGTEGIGRKRAPSIDPSITGDDGSSVYSFASSAKVSRALPNSHPVIARANPSEAARLKPPSLFPEDPPAEDGERKVERGLFDDSLEEDESVTIPKPLPRQTATLNDTTKPSFFKGSIQPAGRKIANLFDDEPPEPDLPEQPFATKKSINLFIESDDEDIAQQNERNNNASQVLPKEANNPPRMDQVKAKNTQEPGAPHSTNSRTMGRLVDELNNNFRRQQQLSSLDTQKTNIERSPNVHRTLEVNNQKPSGIPSNLFDDEPPIDDFDKLFSASSTSHKSALQQNVPPRMTEKIEKKAVNLFAEDEDDFDGIVVGSNEAKPEKSPQRSAYSSPNRIALPKPTERVSATKKKSIFDESDSEEASANDVTGDAPPNAPSVRLPAPKIQTKAVKSIFSDSSDDEDDDEALFGKSSSILKNKLDAMKNSGFSAKGSLAAVLAEKSLVTKPSNVGSSLFDNGSDSNDIIYGRPNTLDVKQNAKNNGTVTKVSLFDDQPPSDDDEGTLFDKNRSEILQPQMKATEPNEVRKQPILGSSSIDGNQEQAVHSAIHPDEPITAEVATGGQHRPEAGSIRSVILKKSIFNSDSESDESDSIFATEFKHATAPEKKIETSSTEVVKVEKHERSLETNQDLPTTDSPSSSVFDTPLISSMSESLKANQAIDQNAGVLSDLPTQQTDSMPKDLRNDMVPAGVASTEEPVADPCLSKKSLVEEPTPKVEAADDSFMVQNKTKLEATMSSLHPNIGEEQALESADNSSAQLEVAAAEKSTSDECASSEVSQETLLPTPPVLGKMIANDIDYYLRTKEPLQTDEKIDTVGKEQTPPKALPSEKSEPKSALNFSPIGLFDDLPPPDDEGDDDTDKAVQPKHLLPAESVETSEPPIEDDVAPYSMESQSLNFVPSGGSGSNKSRYLFDDEPPPDEPDNNRQPDFGSTLAFKKFGGNSVTKGLFDHPHGDATASLPPLVEDNRGELSKPVRPKINKLNTKIAINVAALLPGAKRPPSVASTHENVGSPESRTGFSPEDKDIPSSNTDEQANGEKLTGLNKGRARIPSKRKPPSRQSLRSRNAGADADLAVNNEREGKELEKPHATNERIVVGSEVKIEHVEATMHHPGAVFPPLGHSSSTATGNRDAGTEKADNTFIDRLSASVRNPAKRLVLPDADERSSTFPAIGKSVAVKRSTKTLFGDSDSNGEADDDDSLFRKLPSTGVTKPPASVIEAAKPEAKTVRRNVPSRSIFGTDDEDDTDAEENDLFGTKKSTIVGQLKSKGIEAGQKERKSLFEGDDDDEDADDDDLFGTNAKPAPKANSQITKPANRSVATLGKLMTTTTHPVDDPLADLLADS